MDPLTIIATINAGVSLFKSVDSAATGVIPANVQAILQAGASIIQTATTLYATVQADLSANDQASVDAALTAAQAQCGDDLTRVLAEIAADAGKA